MRRVSVSLVLLFAVQAILPSPIQGEEPAAKETSREEIKQRLRKIQIGKETTHIEGPLDKDGNVDYLAAMNARASEGVTPENNAAVELWMAAGPGNEMLDVVDSREFFKALGIRRFPSYSSYMVAWEDFALPDPVAAAEDNLNAVSNESLGDDDLYLELERRLNEAMVRPWTIEEFPKIAQWLDRNQEPLKHIEKAVDRERFYEPICWSLLTLKYGNYEVAEPTVDIVQTVTELLAARAMRRLGAGDLSGCAEDAFRLHRLAQLVCQSPTSYSMRCGSAITFATCSVSRALADAPAATSELLLAHLAQIEKIPPDKRLVERYDYYERLIYLAKMEATIHAARKQSFEKTRSQDRDFAKVFDAAFGNIFMDWNEPLRIGNRFFDATTAALRRPNTKASIAALEQVAAEYDRFVNESEEADSNLLTQILQQKSISKAFVRDIARTLLGAYFHPADDYFADYRRMCKQQDLIKIALAVAAFQRDHGAYPRSLAELSPRYLPQTPIDADNGLPYQIRLAIVSLGVDGQDDDVSDGYDDIDLRLREVPAK